MKFGLTEQQYSYIQEIVVLPLRIKGASIWVFGSRARGDHSKFSDLDLMVECEDDVSACVSRIQETLETGNFPFKVDIVLSKDFAESYRESFAADKVEFQG